MTTTNVSLNYNELSLILGLVNHHFSFINKNTDDVEKCKKLYEKIHNAM